MPEGDTIAQSAATLAGVLAGRTVTGFRSSVPGIEARADSLGVVGGRIGAVEARGKHLLIHIATDDAGGAVLRTHLRMTGSWHLYRLGTRWRKPAGYARVILEAGDVVAVCFSAPEVELLSAGQVNGHAALQRLGPDLLAPAFDETEALARLRRPVTRRSRTRCSTSRSSPASATSTRARFCSWNGSARSRGSPAWTTTRSRACCGRRDGSCGATSAPQSAARRPAAGGAPSGSTTGPAPCARCATPIRRALQGPHARSTYWCPTCQPQPSSDEYTSRR